MATQKHSGLSPGARHVLVVLAVLAVAAPPARSEGSSGLTGDDFVVVSGPTSPRVAYALKRDEKQLRVIIDMATFAADGSDAAVDLGLSAAKTVILKGEKARTRRGDHRARFTFTLPVSAIVTDKADWPKLRMALAAAWRGGPAGADRLRERFRHSDRAAPHAGLSQRPAHWLGLDIEEHEAIVADRRDRITIAFHQPMGGKATVVIEDEGGHRIRNLIAGATMPQGPHALPWDGLDDSGQLVRAGAYRWRSIHHPGIVPEYLMSFCNGGETFLRPFGSNHGHFVQAATNGKYVFFGAPITEGGYALIACDPSGRWKHGYVQIHGTGIHQVAIAADSTYFYAAHDGPAWGQQIDRKKPNWQGTVRITLTRFEIESGRPVAFGKGAHGQFAAVETYPWGPGAASANCRKDLSLAGMAWSDGKLYLASRNSQAILVVDPATAHVVGRIALASPGPIAAAGGKLWAVSGERVLRFDTPAARGRTVIPAGKVQPAGLAAGEDGTLYVSDNRTHQVRVFDASGRQVGRFGKSGGAYQGTYDPERMVKPAGLTVAGGTLWVTERRVNPKRLVAWDVGSGRIVASKYGCPPYGGPMASFDTADHTRWLGLGARWKVDLTTHAARPTSVLQASAGHIGGYYPWCIHYRHLHKDGRTFLIGMGKATFVSELMPDGSVKDLAFVATCHHFSYGCHWQPPQAYIDAFNRAFPDRPGKHADKGPGVMWIDRNGDGLCQAAEFNFATTCRNFGGSGWGYEQHDLNLHFPVTLADGRHAFVVIRPNGYTDSGAPNYPTLDKALAGAVGLRKEVAAYDYKQIHVEAAADRFGNLVFNTDPQMVCYSPEGRLRWQYPNRWVGVHGSHNAPLPATGVLQGTLFFLGMAPLDDKADVFMMNGNHGRFFVMTSDGLYLDEMFKDVRMGGAQDATYIGGEAFGGFFARSEKDGNYYLQTGGDGYRIYRISGLGRARRAGGTLSVTPKQILAAERKLARKLPARGVTKEASIARAPGAMKIDAQDRDWPRAETLAWDRNGHFGVKVRLLHDTENLYLFYDVKDASPWINGGKDWTTLFKTGDSVDIQLATDPAAPPKRKTPAGGDLRLLIAPFEGKPLAVVYTHRVAGASSPVTFTSPWRSETVDVVRKLGAARIAVSAHGDRYRLEAAVPLSELGLTSPAGRALKADFGVIYGDRDGTINTLRSYWANQATMLVNDVPGEIMLHPDRWGIVRFEGK